MTTQRAKDDGGYITELNDVQKPPSSRLSDGQQMNVIFSKDHMIFENADNSSVDQEIMLTLPQSQSYSRTFTQNATMKSCEHLQQMRHKLPRHKRNNNNSKGSMQEFQLRLRSPLHLNGLESL